MNEMLFLKPKRYINLFHLVKNWRFYFESRHIDTPNHLLTFHMKDGMRVKIPRTFRGEFRDIFLDDTYELASFDVGTNPLIIDIGANVGLFSLYAALRFRNPNIYAYEPLTANIKLLNENTTMNSRFLTVHAFQKAVSNSPGEIMLNCAGATADDFSTMASICTNAAEISVAVPATTLKEIFEDNGIDKCDLLKLDCEGAEYAILYNCPPAYLSRISHICMEVHQGDEPGQNIGAMINFLNENGFKTRTRDGCMLWGTLK